MDGWVDGWVNGWVNELGWVDKMLDSVEREMLVQIESQMGRWM